MGAPVRCLSVTEDRRADYEWEEIEEIEMKQVNQSSASVRGPRTVEIALAVVVVAVSTLLFYVFPVSEWLAVLAEWSRENPLIGGGLLIALYAVATVLGLPGLVLTLAAGFLFGLVWGTAIASAGSVLGATAALLVGRFVARDWVAGRIGASDRFQAIDRAVGRKGFKIVLLTRLSPVFPFNVLNYLFGLTDVRLRDYVLASWIGMLPATVLYVYYGTTIQNLAALIAGEFEGGAVQGALLVGGLAATLAVAVLVARIARRAIAEEIPTQADEAEPSVAVEEAPIYG